MRLNPVDILANWYNDETLPWSAQKAVNCLAETAEVGGTRSVSKTKGLPGLTVLANLGTGAPIRGAEDVEGTLFVVSGNSLFQINPDNSFTNRGNIPGVSLVSMAHNKQGGTTAANELVIANGLSGYVYNTETTVLSQITDDAFPGATTFDYVDGYISFTDPEGRFWGHSALNQATQYSSIDRYDAESAPDKIISHIVSHREVMVFGTRTTEFFRNTGAATGTFQRVDGTEMEVGIAAPLARARLDNTVYWLGNDGIVYRLAGHSPQRVSTRPIEQAISRFNLVNAFAHIWEDRGHKVFYLTFPDGLTFGFDVATSLWHARETYGLNRWGVNTTTRWNGQWVAGDYSNGKLYRLNWDDFTEDGRPLVMECQPGMTHADGNDVLCPYVELFMDTGQSPNPSTLDPIQITGNAPNQQVNSPYSYTYNATGGFGIYTFTTAGPLPGGLTLSPEGVLSGIPTATGSFTFMVTVTDSIGGTASLNDTVVISFTSNLVVTSQPRTDFYSGIDTTFPVIQSIPLAADRKDISGTDSQEFYGVCTSSSFIVYKRNTLGAYILVSPTSSPVIGNSQGVTFTADGTYCFVVDISNVRQRLLKWNGTLYSEVQNLVGSINGVSRFSPDGEYLAVAAAAPNTIQIYRRAGDVLTLLTHTSALARGVAWHRDGRTLAYSLATSGFGIRVVSISGNTVTPLFVGGLSQPENSMIRWSHDGQYLFAGGGPATPFLKVYQWNGITLTPMPDPAVQPGGVVQSMDLTEDGRILAVSQQVATGGSVHLYEVNGGTLTHLTTGIDGAVGDAFLTFAESSNFWSP